MDSKTYQRALDRAYAEHLEITDVTHGETITSYHVAHPEDTSGYYTVNHVRGSRTLGCNCEAGRREVYCKHRALVHDQMETDQMEAAEQAAEIAAERRNSNHLDGHDRVVSMDDQIEDARDRWLDSLIIHTSDWREAYAAGVLNGLGE